MKKILIILFLISSSLYAKVEKFYGIAIDKQTQKMLYQENHLVSYDMNGKVQSASTDYIDPQGNLLATLKSDFSKSISAPDHVFFDNKKKSYSRMKKKSDHFVLEREKKGKIKKKTINMSRKKNTLHVGSQGLHYYMTEEQNRLQELKTKKLKIRFILPGLLNYYTFKLNFDKTTPEGNYVFNLKIASWLLGLFTKQKMIITYNPQNRRMLSYSGVSNLSFDSGDLKTVDIKYYYE